MNKKPNYTNEALARLLADDADVQTIVKNMVIANMEYIQALLPLIITKAENLQELDGIIRK